MAAIDRSGFLKAWWDTGAPVSLLAGPPGFGKTSLLKMTEEFFSQRSRVGSPAGSRVAAEGEFVRQHQHKHKVVSFDFGSMRGGTFKEALAELRATGYKAKLAQVVSSRSKLIVLIDNLDYALMAGFLGEHHGETIVFMNTFLTTIFASRSVERCLMTAHISLFLRELEPSLPRHMQTHSIYDPVLGQYLGIPLPVLLEAIGSENACVPLVLHKLGGYCRLGQPEAPQPLNHVLHSRGLIRFLGASSTREACETNAFEDLGATILELAEVFGVGYEQLLHLIHSTAPLDYTNPSAGPPDDCSRPYSFSDFITVLHDFGLLTCRAAPAGGSSEMLIPNSDARIFLLRLSDEVLLADRSVQR